MFEIAKDYKDACQNKTMKNWHFSTYFFSKVKKNYALLNFIIFNEKPSNTDYISFLNVFFFNYFYTSLLENRLNLIL